LCRGFMTMLSTPPARPYRWRQCARSFWRWRDREMLRIENTEVLGWEASIRGMRNPKNSWEKSDSEFHREPKHYFDEKDMPCTDLRRFVLGPNDLDLMKRLRNAGTDHRKFMRMITVYVDIL